MKAQRGSRGIALLFLYPGGLVVGGWSTPHPDCFTPLEGDPVPIVQEAGWAPGPVWMGAKNLPPPGFDPWPVQPVVNHCTDCAVLAQDFHFLIHIKRKLKASLKEYACHA
jgi:hypothetical protein